MRMSINNISPNSTTTCVPYVYEISFLLTSIASIALSTIMPSAFGDGSKPLDSSLAMKGMVGAMISFGAFIGSDIALYNIASKSDSYYTPYDYLLYNVVVGVATSYVFMGVVHRASIDKAVFFSLAPAGILPALFFGGICSVCMTLDDTSNSNDCTHTNCNNDTDIQSALNTSSVSKNSNLTGTILPPNSADHHDDGGF